MEITVVEIRPAGEFGGHVFEYDRGDDLFKCVNRGCGIPEFVARRDAREQGIGEITPCPAAEPVAAEPAGNGCPRGCKDPTGEDCKASLISPCPQGRYQGEETWLSANDGCSGCGGLDGECYCGEDDDRQALIAETIERDDDPVNEFDY